MSRQSAWIAAAIIAVALAAGCGGEPQAVSPAGPSVAVLGTGVNQASSAGTADKAASEAKLVPRNVSGRLDGRFDFTRLWGEPWEWWKFYSDGLATGTVSHLGLSELRTTHVPDLATGALTKGTFRIVAANGDEIQGTYEGSAAYDAEHPDELAHGKARFVITGGTGRFAGATGAFNATFLETFDDPSWSSARVAWTLAGTVNY